MPLYGLDDVFGARFPGQLVRLFQLPDFVPKNQGLYEACCSTHDMLCVGARTRSSSLHVAAALKHHYVLKDDVLRRMLPFTKTRDGNPHV